MAPKQEVAGGCIYSNLELSQKNDELYHMSGLDKNKLTSQLTKHRATSSIPRSENSINEKNWTYPSAVQFYRAIMRKENKTLPPDTTAAHMEEAVLAHNQTNEESWKAVLRWEELHKNTCPNPTLKRFVGKYSELSPFARFKAFFAQDHIPFDRHDWFVDRCGKQVRYILDYYDNPKSSDSLQMNLHCRPALDSFQAVVDRFRLELKDFLKGNTLEKPINSKYQGVTGPCNACTAETKPTYFAKENRFTFLGTRVQKLQQKV